MKIRSLSLVWTAALVAGCSGTSSSFSVPSYLPTPRPSGGLKHIVLVIQENRTFNNLFAGFPGAVSAKVGYGLVKTHNGYRRIRIPLAEGGLTYHRNPMHLYEAFLTAYQNGNMDGFNIITYGNNGKPEGTDPYQYVNPTRIGPYWDIASRWGLADEMFQTQGSDSFTAHQQLIRGGTFIDSSTSLIDPPTSGLAWGCDSKPGTRTSLIDTSLHVSAGTGPFPCSNQFPDYGSNGYRTLRDLLDAKSVSWKYYTPLWQPGTSSALWNAFDAIAPVRYGPEWSDGHISSPETNIFKDVANGKLPAMSWVIPSASNSDHPGYATHDTGPSWVADVVNAIGQSSYWSSTAVIVVWDDWGGFYDPVAPPLPRDNQGGPGFRVPMLVISPYVVAGSGSNGGYVSHTVYEFGSIVRFIENTWSLGRLGTTDATSASIGDMFDFRQTPRAFQRVPSRVTPSFFVRQSPSTLPVDSD